MKDWQSQNHVKWKCKYHVVIVSAYGKKVMCGELRHQIGEAFRQLCHEKEIELLQGRAMADHVNMLLSIPLQYSIVIVMTIGYFKGKSAIRIHRDCSKVRGTLFGHSSWSPGYYVSTVVLDFFGGILNERLSKF